MNDGIYKVQFNSRGNQGWGLVFVVGSKIYGGDFAYYYTGEIQTSTTDDTEASMNIHVKRFNEGKSVFGPLDELALQCTGRSFGDGSVHIQGHLTGQPAITIKITGQRIDNCE
jgi:hypothetical protein